METSLNRASSLREPKDSVARGLRIPKGRAIRCASSLVPDQNARWCNVKPHVGRGTWPHSEKASVASVRQPTPDHHQRAIARVAWTTQVNRVRRPVKGPKIVAVRRTK